MKPLVGDQDVDVIPNPLYNQSIPPELKNEVVEPILSSRPLSSQPLSPRPLSPQLLEKPQDIEPIQGLTIPRLD
jgi:hypothetical protein